MANFITPPTDYPFRPGEAVYFLPAMSHMTAPPPRIRCTVINNCGYSTFIQREDDGRRCAVNTDNLGYRAHCDRCYAPAIKTKRGRLACPACGGAVVDQPPLDEMTMLWFPLAGWRTAMIVHRAVLNPTWTYRQAAFDRAATIERSYQAMLDLLDLEEPTCRGGEPFMADAKKIDLLKYYSMLEHEDAFAATYEELMFEQLRDSGDGPGWPSRRLSLPSHSFVRPANDSEPDGEDALTHWLDQQFQVRA